MLPCNFKTLIHDLNICVRRSGDYTFHQHKLRTCPMHKVVVASDGAKHAN